MSYERKSNVSGIDTYLKHQFNGYTGPTKKKASDKIKDLEMEISWLIGRLGNLVLSDEDRQQTEDYIWTLRQEQESLKRCFNV